MNDPQQPLRRHDAPAPDNPMDHPEEQPTGTEAPFQLGRLLLFLAGAVAVIAFIALVSAAYFGL